MTSSYRALCSDFYINQKLGVKLDLPKSRETVLELFERLRKQFPGMSQFRRYKDELALESASGEDPHRWLAIRSSNIRSGVVNPENAELAYGLHTAVVETTPFFLSISPLDIDFVELLFGFDVNTSRAHDEVVRRAVFDGTPMGELAEIGGARAVDCQPLLGLALDDAGLLEAHFEVKTRAHEPGDRDEPISVYLTMRRYGPVSDLKDLPGIVQELAERGEHLVEDRLVPALLRPIRDEVVGGAP
jgi:hypothetical protein